MSTHNYSEKFKRSAIQKLMSSDSLGLSATAKKIGIAPSTLFGWKKKYAHYSIMKQSKKDKTIANWTPEKKLEALMKTASMKDSELGEYLRKNGLHSSDLERFKADFLSVPRQESMPRSNPELVELKKAYKSLKVSSDRTKKALAEQSARIILLKKSHEIWGDPEVDE